MSRAKIVDYYLARAQEPDFEIDQIRKELEPQHISDEEIRIIVRIIDNEIHRKALTKSVSSKGNELVTAGSILTLVGGGITIGTYTGLLDMGDSFLLVYGPFFGGLSLLFTGLTLRKK